MSEDRKIQMIGKFIKDFFGRRPVFEGWYSDYDDNTIDYKITYELSKLRIKKGEGECTYNCVADILLTEILQRHPEDDEWVKFHYADDLPGYVIDELNEDILVEFEGLMPHVCMLLTFTDED